MILCWTDLSAFVGVVWFHLLHFDTPFRYRLYLMDFMVHMRENNSMVTGPMGVDVFSEGSLISSGVRVVGYLNNVCIMHVCLINWFEVVDSQGLGQLHGSSYTEEGYAEDSRLQGYHLSATTSRKN